MAIVTELVTEFKFKGDTKPLKDAGDSMKNVSENSGVASKRMDNAGESLLGMGKNALTGLAGIAALGAALAKITKTVFDLGKETAELKGLGIDPIVFRETEDLFSRLGAAEGDAATFVKKIAEAQAQLSLGKDSPFARSLQEQFGVLVNEGDKVEDVLSRLREATEKQGFTAGQISVKAGELGFSPEFSKVLLATNRQFAEAKRAIGDLAKTDRAMLDQTEEARQAMKNLGQSTKRLTERISAGLAPIFEALISVAQKIVDGWSFLFNLADEKLTPIFEDMFEIIDENVIPALKDVSDFLNDFFLPAFEAVADFLGFIPKNGVLGDDEGVARESAIRDKAIIGSFFPLAGLLSLFTGSSEPGSSGSSNSNVSNKSSTIININGPAPENVLQLIRQAVQKNNNMAAGAAGDF
jgi:hypothetical protein